MLALKVEGMTCGGCARTVTNAIRNVDPEAVVEIDLANKRVKVESSAEAGAIEQAIANAGYKLA
jgi:copper chaperone